MHINRRYVPSKRDVLNWFRGHEIGHRVELGKTALIEKLENAKVILILSFDYVLIIILNQEALGIRSILQHDESSKCFRIIVVTELMKRCHALRASGVMVRITCLLQQIMRQYL